MSESKIAGPSIRKSLDAIRRLERLTGAAQEMFDALKVAHHMLNMGEAASRAGREEAMRIVKKAMDTAEGA
jgi:hypothetical protein